MNALVNDLKVADDSSVVALLTSLESLDPAERRRHASVFNYWLSIRGNRQFPAIRDLDPLEISDAGPSSVLMELIGGGEDAEIRHLGHAIKSGGDNRLISEAPVPSLLACIHDKLPTVASTRQAFVFEEEYATSSGAERCWVTLLPLSANGTWIDFVYAFVSLALASDEPRLVQDEAAEPELTSSAPDPFAVELRAYDEPNAVAEEPATSVDAPEQVADVDPVHEAESEQPLKTGFSSKLMEGLASVGGFYGKVAHAYPEATNVAADEPYEQPHQDDRVDQQAEATQRPPTPMEGSLQDKLSGVRAIAEEAREAQERSNQALYQGLGAAYDFALDAEDQPEDYLRLVEAQGLKIQLRSPMTPVVKLAFAGLTDDDTIRQLEGVLAWALKNDLPRGSLAERIQAEGGVGRILAGGGA